MHHSYRVRMVFACFVYSGHCCKCD